MFVAHVILGQYSRVIGPARTIEELDQEVREYIKSTGAEFDVFSYGLNDLNVDDEFNLPIRTIMC